MGKSFKQGVLVGIFAPLAFVAGVVIWIYRYTGRIPFATRRTEEGEMAVRLVDPEDVPGYWENWKREIDPLVSGIQKFVEEIREQVRGDLDAERDEWA